MPSLKYRSALIKPPRAIEFMITACNALSLQNYDRHAPLNLRKW